MARYGIGAPSGRRNVGGGTNTPPTNPGNGSGGAGVLVGAVRSSGGSVQSTVRADVSDLTAGRITLGLVELTLVGLIGFYLWTRTAQGG